MGSSKKALIFLSGKYDPGQTAFYIDQIRKAGLGVQVIAVDGALCFFDRLGVMPDLIVGDMDSVEPDILGHYSEVSRREFPADKDYTDGELAVRIALEAGATEIILLGWEAAHGEVDHMFGNAFLLFLGQNLSLRSPGLEVRAVTDGSMIFRGQVGDRLSVVPLSEHIHVRYRGCRFPLLAGEVVEAGLGETKTLRNQFSKTQVEVAIQGKALVIHTSF